MAERPARIISGMAQGVDSFAFDIAVELGIPVTAAVPWIGHGSNWPTAQQREYLARLEKAADVKVTSDTQSFAPWVYSVRNRWMVDNSDLLVGVWNGARDGGTWDAIQYSRKMKREPKLLNWSSK